MKKRIYVVSEGKSRFLVEAGTSAEAIKRVVSPRFTADVATPEELIELVSNGVKVMRAEIESVANGVDRADTMPATGITA